MREFGLRAASDVLRPAGPDDSKYTRGVVGLMTGSEEYPGAAVLGVDGAARTGAGYVRYVGPRRCQDLVLSRRPETVLAQGPCNAWVMGSGMADVAESDDRYAAMESLLTDAPETSGFLSRGGAATPAFRIVDAGALMEFSKRASHHGDNDLNRDNAHCVITPHSGELAKILAAAGHSDITHRDIDASPSSRLSWAQRARDAFRCTVVLKGAKTLVVPLEGDVLEVTAPTHWLATAGTGDVLAGIMGTVVAQMSESIHAGTLSLAEAAALAVVLHGYAAGLASATMSDDDPRDTLSLMLTSRVPGQPIVASDLARAIPVVIGALLAMKRARGDSAPIGFHAASSASDDGAATGFTR